MNEKMEIQEAKQWQDGFWGDYASCRRL